jgi:hypothetical protein
MRKLSFTYIGTEMSRCLSRTIFEDTVSSVERVVSKVNVNEGEGLGPFPMRLVVYNPTVTGK